MVFNSGQLKDLPACNLAVPSFARESAVSLPSTLQWEGISCSVTAWLLQREAGVEVRSPWLLFLLSCFLFHGSRRFKIRAVYLKVTNNFFSCLFVCLFVVVVFFCWLLFASVDKDQTMFKWYINNKNKNKQTNNKKTTKPRRFVKHHLSSFRFLRTRTNNSKTNFCFDKQVWCSACQRSKHRRGRLQNRKLLFSMSCYHHHRY